MTYFPTCDSYFAGGGLMDIGLMQAGVRIVQSSDIDPKATETMHRNPHYFSHRVYTGDVKDMLALDQPNADILVFTYPCTKYSTVADIHGTRTGDDLFLHALRMVAMRKPEMYVIENVVGMKKFKVVMETMTKLPDYYVHVECPLQTTHWLPQKRDRLIVIATRKPFTVSSPKPLGRKPLLRELLEENPEVPMPDYVLARLKGEYRDLPIVIDPSKDDAIAPTCVAHYSKDLGTRLVKDNASPYGVRPFSVREWARLQGVPDDYIMPQEQQSYKTIGNGVPVPMGRWIGEQAIRYFNQ